MFGRRALTALLALLPLAGACQKIAGFRDFGGSGQAESGVGDACESEADCPGQVCVVGRCRLPCDNDADCNDAQLCMRDGGRNGCRLSSELSCASVGTACDSNPALACALDHTCRPPCANDSDCLPTAQACIAGTCVGNDEPGSTSGWFACTPGRSCGGSGGRDLISCDETSPGPTVLDSCSSVAACMHGTDSGACASPSCTVGSTRCSEDAIETCSDGFGFEQTLGPCASEALCELTRGQTNATQCASPACNAGNARCRDGAVESCSSDLTGYDSSKCPTEQPRCNPSAGQCISLDVDATEVTQGEYAAFLGSVNKPELPPACAFKSNFAPDSSCVATVANCTSSDCTKLPQSCVDWCDAWAYCTAAGKHLCGRIGGGILPFDSFADPGVSEWSNACTSGGEYAFPYGDSEVNKDCKGAVNQPNQTIAVGSLASCQSPVVAYAGLFDLSGNIAEWDDSCAKAATGSGAGASDECHVRGGSYLAENAELACAASRTLLRSQTSPEVGFRCCGAGQ